jgi:outer membrane receptor for ferrienterochelin and colicin
VINRDKRFRLLAGSMLAGMTALAFAPVAFAQQAQPQEDDAEIVVTGTRIQAPGIVSSSPIATIGAEELAQQNQSQVERILRVLPISVPGDGENTNNGTAGVATVNLRGLGAQRNLIMIDGKRVTP